MYFFFSPVRRGWKGRASRTRRRWTPSESEIVQKWVDNDWLVILEGLDDLYWMYATVSWGPVDRRRGGKGMMEAVSLRDFCWGSSSQAALLLFHDAAAAAAAGRKHFRASELSIDAARRPHRLTQVRF